MIRHSILCGASALAVAAACLASPAAAAGANGDTLPDIEVTADRVGAGAAPIKDRQNLPQTAASVTKETIDAQVNVIDSEDAVKYLPSLFVRKRNAGDTQPVLATRTWGVNSSARTLVYADDILLSALIANNNTIGAPRWGLIAPEEIERVDFLYGPYAAAFPGNSIGGVLQFTTRMPDKFEWSAKQTTAWQTFTQYGTSKLLPTTQTSGSIGGRSEAFSWFLSGNFQDSYSQPLTYVTNATAPAGTTGTYAALNRTGGAANVVGAGGLLHTDMVNLKSKFALDITPWLRATYTAALWQNIGRSDVDTYLTATATGRPTFGGLSGFASGRYSIQERHLAQSLSLKTDTKDVFDWDVSVSRYDVLDDIQRNPWTVTTGTGFSTYGKITRLDGTNWTNADAKGIWRPFGPGGAHEVSFGVHADLYRLSNPVYRTATWESGPSSGDGTLYSTSRGTTATNAVFLQDAWKFAPGFKATLGGRLEDWTASNGFTLNTTTNATTGAITGTSGVNQASVSALRFSPKAALEWQATPDWTVSGAFGVANRFPTVTELYQTVTSGTTIISPNPNLKPERALSGEVAIERRLDGGRVRLSLFTEDTFDALVSQSSYVAPNTTTLFTVVGNVDHIRNRGIEIAAEKNNVLIDGLQLSGSVTWVDSRIIADRSWGGATSVVGKHVPYVPDFRSTIAATYRPNDVWAFTLAARYSGRQFATLDNTDVISKVYQSFDRFLVADLHAQYKLNAWATLDFGIDNIADYRYMLFHPFPGRTFFASAKIKL